MLQAHDFEDFADVVNWWLADEYVGSRWRLQELSKSDLSLEGLGSLDGPSYGRRYGVFYNQVHLGTLEIKNGLGWDTYHKTSVDYSTKHPNVLVYVEIEYIRLLSYEVVRDFLFAIIEHTCKQGDSKERNDAEQAVDRAMIAVVWKTIGISELDLGTDYGELNLRFKGTAEWYIVRKQTPTYIKHKQSNAK
jgi:hypothetical protein